MAKKQPKTNAMRGLDVAGISYETLSYHCDGQNFDGQLVAAQVGLPAGQVFKTLVAQDDKGGYVVCCIPVDGRLDLKALAAAAGCKRLDMLPLERLLAVTGYVRGGCSPAGMKKQYPTVLDETAFTWDKIAVSAGVRGLQLLLAPDELAQHTQAKAGRFTMPA